LYFKVLPLQSTFWEQNQSIQHDGHEAMDTYAGEESEHVDRLQRAADLYVRSKGTTGKRPPVGFVRAAEQRQDKPKGGTARGGKKMKRATNAAAEVSADTVSTSVQASYEEASFGSHRHHGSVQVTTEVCKH
jgi:hypothetical protein